MGSVDVIKGATRRRRLRRYHCHRLRRSEPLYVVRPVRYTGGPAGRRENFLSHDKTLHLSCGWIIGVHHGVRTPEPILAGMADGIG